jgi:hypothetical protein
MKYTISINQYAVVEAGLELDIIDLAILDFIRDFANSTACTKFHTPEGEFLWIAHQLILDNMPLLKIKTKQGVINRIDKMIQADVLRKHPNCEIYGKTLYTFGSNYDAIFFYTPKQNFRGGLNENLGDYNNRDINNKTLSNESVKPQTLFAPEHTPDRSKKTLFRNSEIAALVVERNGLLDYSAFEGLFVAPEFASVDLVYYYHTVADWSDSSNTKRTKNGWIATVRNFIRGDIGKNRVHLKPEYQSSNGAIDINDAMAYLNDPELNV